MNGSGETIVAEAVQLAPDQRLTLAHRTLSSVEPDPSAETDAAWDAEIGRRIARYDDGGSADDPGGGGFRGGGSAPAAMILEFIPEAFDEQDRSQGLVGDEAVPTPAVDFARRARMRVLNTVHRRSEETDRLLIPF